MRQKQWKPRGRLRRIARRSSALWWTAAVTLGVVTASVTSTAIRQTTDAAAAWGTERPVWVVAEPVAAGDRIAAGDVELVARPRGLVPVGALGATSSPVGDAARVALARGEVVIADRLVGRGAEGIAAVVASGRRAIALRSDESTPRVRPGDRVDLLATFDVGDPGSGESRPEPTITVANGAEVVAVSPRAITVSVADREAPRVAFALARGALTVALRGAASGPTR